ncbi:hypothetical protein BC828DRAFT_410163, partial [Blastocladiella britannica]
MSAAPLLDTKPQQQQRPCRRAQWDSIMKQLTPQERTIFDRSVSNARIYSGVLGITFAAASYALAAQSDISNLAVTGAAALGLFGGAATGRAVAMRQGLGRIGALPESERSEILRQWGPMRYRTGMFPGRNCSNADADTHHHAHQGQVSVGVGVAVVVFLVVVDVDLVVVLVVVDEVLVVDDEVEVAVVDVDGAPITA